VSADSSKWEGEEAPDDIEPRPEYSPVRVGVALVMVVALLVGAGWWVRDRAIPSAAAVSMGLGSWFAPYVDATLTPTFQFQDPTQNLARQTVLGFVVAGRGCQPTWGASYSLAQADSSLNLSSRIAQYRSVGGDVIISFGGRDHLDLAQACTTVSSLTKAYQQVISRYHPSLIDFDVEGTALSNVASMRRRAAAVAALVRANGGSRHLGVWVTVPAGPGGVPHAALEVAQTMLSDKVVPSGINVMAMDFGQPEPSMAQAVTSVATAAQAQVNELYQQYGVTTNLPSRFGVTVMIGENDTPGENLSIAGATQVATTASARHWGRVSMWSLNRDSQCGSAFAEIGVLSNSCSGSAESTLGYSHLFSTVLVGRDGVGAPATTGGVALAPSNAPGPYPQWSPAVPYPANYKVVRDGEIYQAKWFSQGQDPATVVQYPSETPWQLIGPVLAGSHPPTTTTLPSGTYPVWSPRTNYVQGQRVLFAGLPYQAKWYNQAQSPAAAATDPTGSPWTALSTWPGEPPLS
jgi:chitinase